MASLIGATPCNSAALATALGNTNARSTFSPNVSNRWQSVRDLRHYSVARWFVQTFPDVSSHDRVGACVYKIGSRAIRGPDDNSNGRWKKGPLPGTLWSRAAGSASDRFHQRGLGMYAFCSFPTLRSVEFGPISRKEVKEQWCLWIKSPIRVSTCVWQKFSRRNKNRAIESLTEFRGWRQASVLRFSKVKSFSDLLHLIYHDLHSVRLDICYLGIWMIQFLDLAYASFVICDWPENSDCFVFSDIVIIILLGFAVLRDHHFFLIVDFMLVTPKLSVPDNIPKLATLKYVWSAWRCIVVKDLEFINRRDACISVDYLSKGRFCQCGKRLKFSVVLGVSVRLDKGLM